MREETSAGAAYLSGLKQAGLPQAAGAATARGPNVAGSAETRACDVELSGEANTASAENRRSQRYKCQGSARLQEIGSAASTWATFTDISMHGCYVEAATPYRIGARLDLKLEANGFRIEATGEVRVAYPSLGMGISFTKVSQEDRERLRELVRSISRPSLTLSSRAAPTHPSIPQSEVLPAVADPGAILQAILNFFENRHVMGREEFFKILRKGQ